MHAAFLRVSVVSISLICFGSISIFPVYSSDNPLKWDDVIGLRVDVADSEECGGSSTEAQTVSASASLTGGKRGCPVTLAVTVTGAVETQNAAYDYVYVNGVLFFSGDEEGGECAMRVKTETREIVVDAGDSLTLTYDTSDGKWHSGAYATITRIELVEKDCSSCTPGSGSVQNGSIDVAMKLGRADFGRNAGALRIAEGSPSPALGTIPSLRFGGAADGVEVIRDIDDDLRQIHAPQSLADIVEETPTRFRVDFYDPGSIGPFNGTIYDQTGETPFVTWKFENLDPVNNRSFRVSEIRGGSTKTSDYTWPTTGAGWELVTGGGTRRHKKTRVVNGAITTVTEEVKNVNNDVVEQSVHTYRDFAWGREETQRVDGSGGPNLTTTSTYYENPATDGGSYGRLKTVTRPDGSWARYEYDASGRLVKTVEPFLDAAPGAAESVCRVTTLSYSANAPQETEIVKILNKEVSRRYRVEDRVPVNGTVLHETREIVTTVIGAAHDAATNLVTTTRLLDRGEFTGEISMRRQPDGTGQTYSYDIDANGHRVTIRHDGWFDGETFNAKTATTTLVDIAGNFLSEEVIDVSSGLVIGGREVVEADAFGRPISITHADGTFESYVYGCCGVESHTDRDGIVTTYGYDALGRVILETRAGVSTATTYDAEGRVLTRSRVGSDNSVIVLESKTYDLAGRLVSRADALGQVATFTETVDGNGRTIRTETFAGGTRIETRHRDGRLYSVSGTATRPRVYLYAFDGVEFYEQEIAGTSTAGTEWTRTFHDPADRMFKQVRNGAGTTFRHYDSGGRLAKEEDADGVTTLYQYHPDGSVHRQAIDLNRDGTIEIGDPLTEFSEAWVESGGESVLRRETRVYDDNDIAHLALREETSRDGRRVRTLRWGLETTSTRTVNYPAGSATESVLRPDGSQETRSYSQGRLIASYATAAGGIVLYSQIHEYDPHGRANILFDAATGEETRTHDALDRVTSATRDGRTTAWQYDARGRVTKIVHPDLSETLQSWSHAGDLLSQSGAQTPTLTYGYDAQGRRTSMTTSGQGGQATTTWAFHASSGRLASKTDAAGISTTYGWSNAGRPTYRLNTPAQHLSNWHYDWAGRLDYSAGVAGSLYLTYDRLGRVVQRTEEAAQTTYTHTPDGRVLTETTTSGILSGVTITHSYDALHRRTGYTATMAGSTHAVSFGYDAASRLSSVSYGGANATYGYAPNSRQVASVTRTLDAGGPLTTTYSRDSSGRLTGVANTTPGATIAGVTYELDVLDRRTKTTRTEDGSFWDYTYDIDGQVVSAVRKAPDTAPVPGAAFAFAYDDIGNRTLATINGRQSIHTSNTLNQYTQRTVPGAVDVRGKALASADVLVNDVLAARLGEIFHQAVPVDNTTAPQHPRIRIHAVEPGSGPAGADLKAEQIGRAFVPKTPEVFTYDLDGNLATDGRWAYTWNHANRLVSMETITSVPATAKKKLDFTYDYEGRRVRKRVYDWNGSAWVLANERRYLYDGWNLMAEIEASTTPFVKTYAWGLDVSGTEQGAGGVGGLLMIREGSATHYPCYDGNGNVVGLVSKADGERSARYDYGPFGELLEVEESGISNPFRFSTKFTDGETGLVYYGMRYYAPEMGRWLNRDPIEEEGGVNLYGFVGNDGVGKVDYLGLIDVHDPNMTVRIQFTHISPGTAGYLMGTPPNPVREIHTPRCDGWPSSKGNKSDWIGWYQEKDFSDKRFAKLSPVINAFANGLVSDLGLTDEHRYAGVVLRTVVVTSHSPDRYTFDLYWKADSPKTWKKCVIDCKETGDLGCDCVAFTPTKTSGKVSVYIHFKPQSF